jgi:hypothetical protein
MQLPAAGPSQGGRGPLGGQRSTRSGKRGGHVFQATAGVTAKSLLSVDW